MLLVVSCEDWTNIQCNQRGQNMEPLPLKPYPCTRWYMILQVPTTYLAKMRVDLKFVQLAAEVLEIFGLTCTREPICEPLTPTLWSRSRFPPLDHRGDRLQK